MEEQGIYFGVVRTFRPGSFHAHYDIVKHEPGRADVVLARNALYPDADFIVKCLNSQMSRQEGSFY